MSRNVFLCALVVAVCAAVGVSALSESDFEKLEGIDFASIMSNKRLRQSYINCVLDKGPCTTDGAEFKKIIPDLMATKCASCTPKFKEMIRKSVQMFQSDYPEDFATLTKHFDPDGTQQVHLEEFMKSA